MTDNVSVPREPTPLLVTTVLQEFRKQLGIHMDTKHPSSSPGHDAMRIALRKGLDAAHAEQRTADSVETVGAVGNLRSLPQKSAPRWVTSWPEWLGIDGNVAVVPASDYDALLNCSAEQRTEVEMSHDRGYLHGLRVGWNFGVRNDETGFHASQNAYRRAISEAKAEQRTAQQQGTRVPSQLHENGDGTPSGCKKETTRDVSGPVAAAAPLLTRGPNREEIIGLRNYWEAILGDKHAPSDCRLQLCDMALRWLDVREAEVVGWRYRYVFEDDQKGKWRVTADKDVLYETPNESEQLIVKPEA